MKRIAIVFAAVFAVLIGGKTEAVSATISPNLYNLTAINGAYAWGNTDWNALAPYGLLDNISDLGNVDTLLSDGYTFAAPRSANLNGIYNTSGGSHSLEFIFNDGKDFKLNSFSFISSRSYSNSTSIGVEYSLNGGSWMSAALTSTGALGISTGTALTYSIFFDDVTADAIRFSTNGSQLSLHEVTLSGSEIEISAVPLPAGVWLFGSALAGMGFIARRNKKKKQPDEAIGQSEAAA